MPCTRYRETIDELGESWPHHEGRATSLHGELSASSNACDREAFARICEVNCEFVARFKAPARRRPESVPDGPCASQIAAGGAARGCMPSKEPKS